MEELEQRLSVSEVMHRGVITCRPETTALAVVRTMAAHRIHSVVVTSRNRAPRLVTDADVVDALAGPPLDRQTALDIAHRAPIVTRSDSLTSTLAHMREAASTHAVVVDRSRTPLGVVSILDVVEALLSARDRAAQ